MAVQEEIAWQISEALRLKLTGQAAEAAEKTLNGQARRLR